MIEGILADPKSPSTDAAFCRSVHTRRAGGKGDHEWEDGNGNPLRGLRAGLWRTVAVRSFRWRGAELRQLLRGVDGQARTARAAEHGEGPVHARERACRGQVHRLREVAAEVSVAREAGRARRRHARLQRAALPEIR